MSEPGRHRIARYQAARRTVNNALAAGRGDADVDPLPFLCECGVLGCNTLIEISARDYHALRDHPRRFAVRAGHAVPGVDRVIGRYPLGTAVVELEPDLGDELSAPVARSTTSENETATN